MLAQSSSIHCSLSLQCVAHWYQAWQRLYSRFVFGRTAHVNYWEDHLCLGHQRSKIVQYILAGSCCAKLLWMKATLSDFGIKFKQVPLFCDNKSTMKLTNNLVQHSRTKHINVRHHFIRDHQQKEDICIESVGPDDQLADIFTKPLEEKRFCKLRNELNILEFSNMC